MEDATRLVRLASDIGRVGVLRAVALRLRLRAFPPGSRRDATYRRLLRRFAWRLSVPARGSSRVGGYSVWLGSSALVPAPVRTILVIKLDHIGDFLLAAPAFALLRRSFPAARITLLCAPWAAPIAQGCALFDAVETLAFFAAQAEHDRPPLPAAAALGALGAFDLALDLRVDGDTRPVLALVHARCKAGYASTETCDMAIVLPQPMVDPDRREGLRHHQRQLLLNLVAAVIGRADPGGDTERMVRQVATPIDTRGWTHPIVVVHPGSGRAIKNWPDRHFSTLCRALTANPACTLVLLGTNAEAASARALVASLAPRRLINLVGTLSLSQSLAVLTVADLFIGNDSGLGHASAALGRATVILFSGVDALPAWAPLGPRAVAIKREVSCSPCYLSRLELCPHGHRCMTEIEPAMVEARVRTLLSEPAPGDGA